MNHDYTIWAKVNFVTSEEFEVDVTAIPLTSNIKPWSGETERKHCKTLAEATQARDELVRRLRARIEDRGDKVLSVDLTTGA